MIKNVKLMELNINIVTVFLNPNSKNYLIEYKYLCCNKNYQQTLKALFFNTYKYYNCGNNNFILLL